MSHISDETSFQKALNELSRSEQRQLGALFVQAVLDLLDDPRIGSAIKCAQNPETPAEEMLVAHNRVKSLEIETYTSCGSKVDWHSMAAHHVASAGVRCVAPESTLMADDNIAFHAAMNCRLARNCATLAEGGEERCSEIEKQYQLLGEFLEK